MSEISSRPKIHIFRIICITLPFVIQSLCLGVMYGLFTFMFMSLLGNTPWLTPLTWIVSPVFGLFAPFYGAWNDSLFNKFRRRALLVVSSLILSVSFVSFQFCHMHFFSKTGANVVSGFVGFVLFFVSQIIMPTTSRSLLFDVLGTGQEMLGNTIITIVGTFGGLSGAVFVGYVPYPFFFSLIFIVVCTIPPLFAGREDWYVKKPSVVVEVNEPQINENMITATATNSDLKSTAAAIAKEQSDFSKLSAFRKIFSCLFRYLKGGPLTRAAACMFLSGVSGYGMLTIGVDFTSTIIYHGDRSGGPFGGPNDAYIDGVHMSSIIMMVSSVSGVVFSFFTFPVLKLFGLKVVMVASAVFGCIMNAVMFIPTFDQWNRKMIWIQFASIPFSSVLGGASMAVPYIVINESVMTDNGLFIAVITMFYILGCFIPSISNFILSSFLPEFLGARHMYQWYCVSYFVYGVAALLAALFIRHGVLYDIIQASLKKRKEEANGEDKGERGERNKGKEGEGFTGAVEPVVEEEEKGERTEKAVMDEGNVNPNPNGNENANGNGNESAETDTEITALTNAAYARYST